MRITKWGEYGILCSLYLAKNYSQPAVGAAEISDKQSIPLQYTHQILQRLRRGGIITSIRGPLGGYRLSRPPQSINLKEVILAVEGSTFQVICDGNTDCQRGGDGCCKLSSVWRELQRDIDRLLESRTLESIVPAA